MIKSFLQQINPLTHNYQITGLKTICTLIAKARKLALYAYLCINCYNAKIKRPTENYNYSITHHLISFKMAPLAKLAVISKMDWDVSLVKNWLVFLHLLCILVKNSLILCLLAPINFPYKYFLPYMYPLLMVFMKIM